MVYLKITWISDQPSYYTPYLPDRTTLLASPNMIVRASLGIQALEAWAAEYQRTHTYRSGAGLVVPKAQISAIRSGTPSAPRTTPQLCSAYVGVFIVPGQHPVALRDHVSRTLRDAGTPAEVEIYTFRPGYEAKGAERLIAAVHDAHVTVTGSEPPAPNPATCSMWRDINSFNEVGIPAITYGPRSENHTHRKSLTIDSLYQAACVYARTIVDICNQEKPEAP
jgi:acetylornithine deacetylase/succinyl-diaminopimelate desuccinylase-like protein